MNKLDKICQALFFAIGIPVTIILVSMHINAKPDTRDYSYESYCDSVWQADPDYYLDVLCTTDEYQEYVETNGQWWED